MIKLLRRLIGRAIPTSLEGKAAAATAALLLLTVLVAAIGDVFLKRLDIDIWNHPWLIVGIASLLIAIPIIVYFGVRYWNRIEESLYPDINEAWRAGMDALRNVGLSIDSAPLFVILGNSALEDVFVEAMQAGNVAFRIARVPDVAGAEPALRWYVDESAIYLFCRRVGALSGLSRTPVRGTYGESIPATGSGQAGRAHAARQAYIGTLTPTSAAAVAVAEMPAWQPAARVQAPPLATDVSLAEESRRLTYLCRLIKGTRRPLCGINGAVTVLPFELESASEQQLQALIDSIRSDAQSIHNALWLRFPVTGLVVGMEKANGFVEFIQTLEPQDIHRRLGAGFDVRRRATSDRLHKLSDGICDSFETFVYRHFRHQEALWQPENNRKLYALLCRIRERLKPKLNIVLRKAFGEGDARTAAGEAGLQNGERAPVFFSGCYLAATGTSPDQQAFIKGVLDEKLIREQARIEWTSDALRVHLLFKIAVWIGWALLGGLLIFLAVTVFTGLPS
jgi:hypothetical protein